MEHANVGNKKWHGAPSSVALACRECKGLITPCIICALPITFVDDTIWVECGYCGAANPMHEHERRLLSLAPPLALTPSMVRRVMVAHIGQRQYTLALLSQFHQFQMDQDIITCSDQNKDVFAQEKLDDTDTVMEVILNTNLNDLPFVEYDGIIAVFNVSIDSNKVNWAQAKDTSGSEPLLKRMRITSENEGLATYNVIRHSESEASSMQMPDQLDAIIKSMHRADCTSREVDINKSSDKYGIGVEDKIKGQKLGLESNEVKVVSENTRCSKCGSSFIETDKFPLTSEGSFMRMETQLLALHSAESLSSDLHSSTSTYPICGSVHVSAIKVANEKICADQHNRICGSHQQFSHFSINVLRLAHSVLASDWKKWLMDGKLHIKEQLIDDVLSCIELFLQKRQVIFHSLAMVWKAMAAQAQSNLDSRAFLEHQLYISAGTLLKDIFIERLQERCNTFKKLLEPFTELLSQINVLLKFCFEQLRSHFKDPYLFPLQLESESKFNGVNCETETALQAVQTAVPLWLLIYHDVAHATVLWQIKSTANKKQF
ncbi:uncharacterized protein LOC131068215 isoform X2 [Cryptomeria japonica]|uniref:uncharacterized protein LOC131068215 isoform X2 n=1 Tax=Cryptomeria japonica TaxID=3369 RepID=UPI0025ACC05F|nr:uncharacterized protein LOC131068215 isoform X2 [Cryptomeria japonica]